MFTFPKAILARYTPLETLGQSQGALTQQVRDEDTGEIVILKSIALAKATSWKQLELFRREARTLSQLEHGHIPRLRNYIEALHESQPSCHLVLSYLPGESLAKRVYAKGPLTAMQAFQVAYQVLEILGYLHHFHPPVIHRDLKPSNLLWEPEKAVYLIDFGGTQKNLAEGETVVGTYGYMAPEQFAGKARPTADLYALGTSLIFLLSAYEPANLPQRDMCLQFRSVVDCPAAMADWIEQLIQPDPQQRFHFAEDALEVLKALFPEWQPYALQTPLALPEHTAPQQAIALTTQKSVQENPQGHPRVDVLQQRYRLLRQYSQRDAVSTYEAEDLEHPPRRVIVKTIAFHLLTHWKDYELFERELKVLRQLEHPGIPRIVDSFEVHTPEGHLLCMVREHIPGLSLADRLQQGWRPQIDEVYHIARQLLAILVFLHEQNPPVVHRDIKPSNVLYTDDKKVYLIDFGALHEHFQLKFTGGSTVVGTLGYMAPEQSTGHTTPASDLYATGLSLIHLLSGIHPSELPHLNLEVQFAEKIHASEAMVRWLMQMSAARQSQRFRNAQDALQALNQLDQHALVLSEQQVQRPAWYLKKDAPLQLKETFAGLELRSQPLANDHMIWLALASGLVPLGILMGFWLLPMIGMFNLLVLPLFAGLFINHMKQLGEEHQYTIHIDKDFFIYHAYREHKDAQGIPFQETLEKREYLTQHIRSIYLSPGGISHQITIQTQPPGGSAPSMKVLSLPIANNAYQAQFIVERLRETVKFYQNKKP